MTSAPSSFLFVGQQRQRRREAVENNFIHFQLQTFDEANGVLEPVRVAVNNVDVHFQDGVTDPRWDALGAGWKWTSTFVHGHTNRLQNAIRLVKVCNWKWMNCFSTASRRRWRCCPTNKRSSARWSWTSVAARPITSSMPMASSGTGVLAIGGDHVSNDLAYGLKVPLSRRRKTQSANMARRWWTRKSKARPSPLRTISGLPLKTVNVEHLRRIMSLRLEESSNWSRRIWSSPGCRLPARWCIS